MTPTTRRRSAALAWLLVAGIAVVALVSGLVVLGPFGLAVIVTLSALLGRGRTGLAGRAAMRALGARPIARWESPLLTDAVAVLATRAGLQEVPAVALLPRPDLNAVATGRDGDAVVAVTPSLLRWLTPRQLIGVLAHEISHVSAADTRALGIARALASFAQTMALTATLSVLLFGPAAFAASWSSGTIMALLWAPAVATLLLLALSRSREHAADVAAVALTGDPDGLADALEVLERHHGVAWGQFAASTVPSWLRTHPTTGARVARLRRGRANGGPPAGTGHDAVGPGRQSGRDRGMGAISVG